MRKNLMVLFMIIILPFSSLLSGCVYLDVKTSESQQLLITSTIQLATATYLDKNSSKASIDMVLEISNFFITTMYDSEITTSTTAALQDKLHLYISDNESLSFKQKIALTSLADLVITQAMAYVDANIEDTITSEHLYLLRLCATAVYNTTILYSTEGLGNKSFSILEQVRDKTGR